jgi:hypothetical protein
VGVRLETESNYPNRTRMHDDERFRKGTRVPPRLTRSQYQQQCLRRRTGNTSKGGEIGETVPLPRESLLVLSEQGIYSVPLSLTHTDRFLFPGPCRLPRCLWPPRAERRRRNPRCKLRVAAACVSLLVEMVASRPRSQPTCFRVRYSEADFF